MRRLIFFVALFFAHGCNGLKAQGIELKEEETFSSDLRRMFSSIPHDAIPYGILYDRVPGWSGLTLWNSGDTTSTSHIKQSWYDLERAMNKPTDCYELLADRIAMAKGQGILPLVTINFENNTKLNTFKS